MANSIGITARLLLICIVCLSCQQKENSKLSHEKNPTTLFSTDTAELAKFLDLTVYKPTRTTFHYTHFDNSAKNERLSIPGPSDSYLHAVLYFDSLTFKKIVLRVKDDTAVVSTNKNEFLFSWLDPIEKDRIPKDSSLHIHRDFIFGGGAMCLTNGMVLISRTSN